MNNDKQQKSAHGGASILQRLVMLNLRWLLFVPAGVFEIVLALFTGLLVTVHYVSSLTPLISGAPRSLSDLTASPDNFDL